MSRRKVRGLTRTGRQVSEDPDLDNLLSTLSPEEMEELEKDMLKVPDLRPEEGKIIVQGENQAARSDTKKKLIQREPSLEGELKKESRKQEYLRKMGLSQEGNDNMIVGVQRQASISSDRDPKVEDKNSKDPESSKGERSLCSSRNWRQESRDGEAKEETNEKEKCEDNKLKDRKDNRESTGSKTKDMISKLKEKMDEKDRKDDHRKTHESKTKDIISKLREKSEKDVSKDRKSESFRTQGLVSKMVEKQSKATENQAQESKPEEKKQNKAPDSQAQEKKSEEKKQSKAPESQTQESKSEGKKQSKAPESQAQENKPVEKKQGKAPESQAQENKPDGKKQKPEENKADDKTKLQRQPSEKGEVQVQRDKAEKRTDREEVVNHSDHVKEKEKKISTEQNAEEKKEKEDSKGKVKNAEETGKLGNCVAKNSPNSKAKAEEEEDEDSSMFDELMEQVRSNDPTLTELNVNNSEVIKTKTLIEFAAALHKNTHVKKFALANCRADDHVAYAISGTLRNNKTLTSINLDSNLLTGKGILSLIQALPHNSTLTELRFQNQRHVCGGKTEMEMTKILKENTTLLKLGYHFELAGPRMTTTNILSRNMDRQRQKRLQEQKQAQANGEKKGTLEVPKPGGGGSARSSPRASPKPSPMPSPMPSPKLTPRKGAGGGPPPPPPPPGGGPPPPPPPMLDGDRSGGGKNSRDQLLASIRGSNIKQLKKVPVPKWLQ